MDFLRYVFTKSFIFTDSSDEESEVEELAMGSESDEIWEEASDQDINQDLDDGNDQQDDDGDGDGDGDDISMSS